MKTISVLTPDPEKEFIRLQEEVLARVEGTKHHKRMEGMFLSGIMDLHGFIQEKEDALKGETGLLMKYAIGGDLDTMAASILSVMGETDLLQEVLQSRDISEDAARTSIYAFVESGDFELMASILRKAIEDNNPHVNAIADEFSNMLTGNYHSFTTGRMSGVHTVQTNLKDTLSKYGVPSTPEVVLRALDTFAEKQHSLENQ